MSLICGVVSTGLVKVLLVKVCEPVKVAIVASTASVTVLPEALESNPAVSYTHLTLPTICSV